MNVLALDTSGPVCGVAVWKDGTIAFEGTVVNKMTHSVNLMPLVDEAFLRTETTLAQMDRIAVTVGPGSFTGVRIGVSCAKGLSHGSAVPCVAVDALEAMALSVPYFSGLVCPLQDARAGQVYGAAFADGKRVLDDCALKVEEFAAAIQALGDRFCFVGDGAAAQRARLTALLGEVACFPPENCCYLRAASVALLGAREDAALLPYDQLLPLYLRPPQAERNRALQEAMNANL